MDNGGPYTFTGVAIGFGWVGMETKRNGSKWTMRGFSPSTLSLFSIKFDFELRTNLC